MTRYTPEQPLQRFTNHEQRKAKVGARLQARRAAKVAKAKAEAANAIDRLCDVYGIRPEALTMQNRKAHLTEARHLLWWFLREHCGYSVNTVASIAERDASTVVKCTIAIRGRMQVDPTFRRFAHDVAAFMATGHITERLDGIEQMGHA